MKKRLLPLTALALLALLAAPASAQPSPPAKTKAPETKAGPAKFELGISQVNPPELTQAYKRLESAQQRFGSGNMSKEELAELTYQVELMVRRTPYVLDLRSSGGPLSAFVEAVSTSRGGVSFTLINAADPADLETPLPPFTLKDANWATIIGVLESFLESRGLGLRFVGGDSPNPAEAKSVVCVLRRLDPVADAKRARSELESFQIGDNIFKDQTVEVIVDAIRTAWELDPANDPAALRIKFHPATKLLLVSGPGPATHIASQVVSGLRKKTPLN